VEVLHPRRDLLQLLDEIQRVRSGRALLAQLLEALVEAAAGEVLADEEDGGGGARHPKEGDNVRVRHARPDCALIRQQVRHLLVEL